MRMNIPKNLLESQETKSGGSSGESRKSAEGARSFTWLNLSGKRTEKQKFPPTFCFLSFIPEPPIMSVTFLFSKKERNKENG